MAKKTRKFGTETAKILQLVIHSLYTNKDIFLRELISNASDACDKLRFAAQSDAALLGDEPELKISLSVDKDKRTITIADNGIGMNEAELAENLGTIAKSGTQGFLEQLSGDKKQDLSLIGQFGVGFYSSFMVAEKVVVHSRKAGEGQGYVWESKGEGEYKIGEASNVSRGTSITLHLRADEDTYLDKFRLQHIVKTYSDHVATPVIFTDEEGKDEQFNSGTALWMRPKSEISDEQYQEFYKAIAHQIDEPFLRLHGKAEGVMEYNYLLFIPNTKPFDLFHPDRMRRVKLYVRRVFIAEEGVEIIPRYLRFLRGIVDSEDLPLNVSRETLQSNPLLERIRGSLTKKILSELKKKSEKDAENYEKFWNNFGAVLKEGLCESLENREQILEVCKFRSTESDNLTNLDEYIARAPEGQKEIYYLSGEDVAAMRESAQLEGFKKRGIEVLLFTDNVDDFWVQAGHEYKGKEFKSVTRSDIDLAGEGEETDAQDEKDNDDLVELFKKELGDKVKDVRISKKLESSPVCLTVAEGDMDIRMERFLREQQQLPHGSTKILEINPNHTLIKSIASAKANADIGDLINLLYDQALIQEGEKLGDIKGFSTRLAKFLEKALVA
ncbi:MAG: molecular chaperone HtpG [Alphaproteobacteria bacterium CG11_big_fil_rev_8_21_14_0_20_44_7]|nr:MAG: molecular chaperone HtpG [Alphaproteobacteria bacterium CG11_big_fil_rev_8_21_14_0_20_44_7]